jgi:hypothetical protein
MTKKILVTLGTLMFVATGCATAFTGEAHVPGGPAGCDARCKGWGLEFVGMVAMGEYSDACVCRRPGAQTALLDTATSAAGGAAGVVMQMRRAEQRQASMHH